MGGVMEYFSKQNTGGSIERKGLVFQDFVAIIYLFRYFSCPDFKSINLEVNQDFSLHFERGEPDLKVQVKINQLSIARIREWLRSMPDEADVVPCYVGSSMNDELRNFWDKAQQFRAIQQDDVRMQARQELQQLCIEKKLDFDRFMKVRIDTISESDAIKIAQAEVYEWAEKRKLFVDVESIVRTLGWDIHYKLSPKRGYLTRDELKDIINKNKVSKIVSLPGSEEHLMLNRRFIEDIEAAMRMRNRDYADLQIIKLLVENGQIHEYKNNIEKLYLYNPRYLNLQLWSLLFLGEFWEILNLCDGKLTDDTSIPLIYAWAQYNVNEYILALRSLENVLNANMLFEETLLAGMCYIQLKDFEKAQMNIERCKKLRPENAVSYLMEAALHPYSKQAMDLVEYAICLDSKCAEAYFQKGKLCRYFGENESSVKAYEYYMELTGEYRNLFVLSELAFACYNSSGMAHEKYQLYFTRWIDQLDKVENLFKGKKEGKVCLVWDWGYDYHNVVEFSLDNKGAVIFQINNDKKFGIIINRSYEGAIGLYCPPNIVNLFSRHYLMMNNNGETDMRKIGISEFQKIREAVAIPALIRVADNEDDYFDLIEVLLAQGVLIKNHESEFMVDRDNIDVYVQIGMKMVNAKVRIGGYIMDIFIPSAKEGLQGFRRKTSQENQFGEAAIVVKGPSKETQITFDASWIEVQYT